MNAPTPLSVAVFGTGFGALHAAALTRGDRARVAAVFSRNAERANALAEVWGATPYTNVEALFRERRLDAVAVALPAPAQVEVAARALELGVPVFLEKPLAHDLASARRLVQLAERARVTTAIDFEFPELRVFAEAKSWLASGRLGALRHVAVNWHVETHAQRLGLETWKTLSAPGGGALNLFTSHCFHYLEWLLGPIAHLSARLSRAPEDKRAGDSVNLLELETVSGLPIALQVAVNAFGGRGHQLELYGDDATLRLSNSGADYIRDFRLLLRERSDPDFRELSSEADNPALLPGEDGRIGATACIAQRFLDGILTGNAVTPNIHHGLRVQELIEAARHSHATGRRIATTPQPMPTSEAQGV